MRYKTHVNKPGDTRVVKLWVLFPVACDDGYTVSWGYIYKLQQWHPEMIADDGFMDPAGWVTHKTLSKPPEGT